MTLQKTFSSIAFNFVLYFAFSTNLLAATNIEIFPEDTVATIQAKTRSVASGSTILIAPGHYTTTIRLTGLHGDAQLPIKVTAAPGAIIEGTYNKDSNIFSNGSGIIIEKSHNVTIQDFTISGFERGITLGSCENIEVRNCKIHDIGNYGVMSYRCNNTKILNNTIERSYREHGIYMSASGNTPTIADNTIRDTHINGIHINGTIVNPTVSNNHLERIGTFPVKEGGAAITLVGGVTDPVVRRNTFTGIYGQGITVDAPNATIADNNFLSYAWSGILGLPKALDLKLTGNTFADSKVIPLQLNADVIPSLTATGQHYAPGIPVCQEQKSQRTYTLGAWKEMGKDVQ